MNYLKQKILRIIADAIIVNISLVTGIVFYAFFKIFICIKNPEISRLDLTAHFNEILNQSILVYEESFWILTIICIIVFYLSGFYTYGRAYRSHYKALIIVQAVSISYIIFAAFNYLIYLGNVFSRGTFIISWIVTILFIETSRLWSYLWKVLVTAEKKLNININTKQKDAVLVIGGAGYLGSLLIRKLLDSNKKVKILDLLLYGDRSIRNLYSYEKNFQVIKGDFRSIDKVVEAVDDVYSIIHLGAIVGDPACKVDPKLTFDVNLMATKMIAEVAKGMSINDFIFASSCSVYGASDEILNEKSTLNPLSLYAKTRLASEKLLLSMKCGNFSPQILRFATLFGLSPRPRFDLVVNLFAAMAVIEKKITIYGGDQWRPFIHVNDCAEAVFRCIMNRSNFKEPILNIGSNDSNYKIDDIAKLVKTVVPDLELDFRGDDVDKRNYRVSFDKMHNSLDFFPKRSIKFGIEEIVKFMNNGSVNDYHNPSYNNYNFIHDESTAHVIRKNYMPRDVNELEKVKYS